MNWKNELFNENEKPLDKLVDGYSHTSVFRTVAFIGDSLSSGEFETRDENNNFVGMLTDSRSFVSYTRHEYFRRILCNLLGKWVEKGECPNDFETLTEIAKGICYSNAKEYFDF